MEPARLVWGPESNRVGQWVLETERGGHRAGVPLSWPGLILVSFTGQPGSELRGTGPQEPVIPGLCVRPRSLPRGPHALGSWLGLSCGEFLPDLWTVLEKLRLPAGTHEGGGGGRVIYTPLALSPELYKQAINQGQAHRPLPGPARWWAGLGTLLGAAVSVVEPRPRGRCGRGLHLVSSISCHGFSPLVWV